MITFSIIVAIVILLSSSKVDANTVQNTSVKKATNNTNAHLRVNPNTLNLKSSLQNNAVGLRINPLIADYRLWDKPGIKDFQKFANINDLVTVDNLILWLGLPLITTEYETSFMSFDMDKNVRIYKSENDSQKYFTLPFRFNNIERRTNNRIFDIQMKILLALTSVDEQGKTHPYYWYPMCKHMIPVPSMLKIRLIRDFTNDDAGRNKLRKYFIENGYSKGSNIYDSPDFSRRYDMDFSECINFWALNQHAYEIGMTKFNFPLTEKENANTAQLQGFYKPHHQYDGSSHQTYFDSTAVATSLILKNKMK
jgi:hypothetical protein